MFTRESNVTAYDVFISHASEDKAPVAHPLGALLTSLGLKVWIDETELRLGDSLREKIDQGLSRSKFGVVILSPSFFRKEWPKREVNALFAIEDNGGRVILPVWHQVSKQDVVSFSPMLADRLAVSTSDGLIAVARSIAQVVQKAGVTVTAALVRQIQAGPSADAMSAFLAMHPRILADAIGHYGLNLGPPKIVLNSSIPPFNLISFVPHGMSGSYHWAFVSFLTAISDSDSDGELAGFLSQCEQAVQSDMAIKQVTMARPRDDGDVYSDTFRVVVFYGRRGRISDEARQIIRSYRERRIVTVHSYDRLLEVNDSSE